MMFFSGEVVLFFLIHLLMRLHDFCFKEVACCFYVERLHLVEKLHDFFFVWRGCMIFLLTHSFPHCFRGCVIILCGEVV